MLTPTFSADQTNEFVILTLKCPLIKAQNVEIDVNGPEFHFYGHPYFLRLIFPHSLVEDGREKTSYNIETGILRLEIPKLEPRFFEDLDMITKLMEIKPKHNYAPMIEVIENSTANDSVKSFASKMEDSDEVNLDWESRQELPTEISISSSYGFNNMYKGLGHIIHQVAHEIIDVKDIDTSTYESRARDRIEAENFKFCPEYYQSDFIDLDNNLEPILNFRPATHSLLKNHQQIPIKFEWSQKELEQLKNLPNKEYLIENEMEQMIFLGLVDIIMAWCYDHRTTEGDHTVESAWTICKISGTLSSLCLPKTLSSAITTNCRRMLAYPLFRSFKLVQKVLKDTAIIFKLGKHAIISTLLDLKHTLEMSEIAYIFDRIYVTDFCIWIQKASDSKLKSLASLLNHYEIKKSDCQFSVELKMIEESVQE